MRSIIFILVSIPIALQAQWNYDNQNIVYSLNGKVGIGTQDPIGTLDVSGNIWAHNGATISASYSDIDPNNSWNSSLSVRNEIGSANTFSRLTFVSESGGFGAISVKKTGDYTGDMYFQVRNGSGFYYTPLLIKSNSNIGLGTLEPLAKLDVRGQSSTGNRYNGTSSDFEALSVFNTTALNLSSGNGAVIQFYNNAVNNNNGVVGASIKSVSANEFYGWESDLYLRTTKNNAYASQTILDALVIKGGSGYVGINTSNPDAHLTVRGHIHSQEVRVDLTGSTAPDYVFDDSYDLQSLKELETYIRKNKHLPEVPSAIEMEENGLNLKQMNLILLKKIEELTLHLIDQSKRINNLEDENKNLKSLLTKK